jgi:integral membrane protein
MTTTQPSAASVLHSGAYKRFQVMAWLTGVLLAFMTVVGLPYKYVLGHEDALWYSIGWQVHGFLYMVYLVTVLDVAIRARWSPGRTVLVALAGTIPFMSFVFERRITHQLRAAVRVGASRSPAAAGPGATS